VNSAINRLGLSYVNDFIDRGQVKRVYLQGEASARMNPTDLSKWCLRNNRGEMVPFTALPANMDIRIAETLTL
jgi:multidrug efflux pump subunit AcrB